MSGLDRERLNRAAALVNQELRTAIGPDGHWVGELSSSALSTATAVTALAVVQRESDGTQHTTRIGSALDWLARHQNADGGWGDTILSLSNLSTTTLCWAAFGAVRGAEERFAATVRAAEKWIAHRIGGPSLPHLTPAKDQSSFTSGFAHGPHAGSGEGEVPAAIDTDALARAVIARYGKDRTFSVPILTMCALAGRLGSGREAWKHVIPLPFELAACPHSWFAALRLPVVSYALPALIAIGQVRHQQSPSRNPVARLLRNLTRESTLRKLTGIQPENGGFLEATPLTSFVTMSLAGSGQVNHPVAKRGVEFLIASQRGDGSWPIDTNLATWVTTLGVNALGDRGTRNAERGSEAGPAALLKQWLLKQQYRTIHPYTHAAPGGWAWTDLPGGVPDADDTAGALLALRKLGPIDNATREAAMAGVTWLLNVQNRDGGIPTFCKGWGALPFDQSSADITAHAIRAWLAWRDDLPALATRIKEALTHANSFLVHQQRPDGTWIPLWFGNQWNNNEENPVYGTARVVLALSQLPYSNALDSGVRWLVKTQLEGGGWGAELPGQPTIEETAVVIEALAASLHEMSLSERGDTVADALRHGVEWLLAQIESVEWTKPSPIGFYFAKLWYFERLYPMIFTVGALNRVSQVQSDLD